MNFHVNSSLPRAGSELMQALLAQHPEVYASATSPLLEYWFGAYSNTQLAEVKSQDPQTMKDGFDGFIKEGIRGYCEALTDKPVYVDKSRGWLEYAEILWELYPDAKIVSMVRPVEDILASLEKIYQENLAHPETRSLPKTVESRKQHFLQNVPLRLALDRINDRMDKGQDSRILYVEYDDLISKPIQTMNKVFAHLELPPHEIDPNNIVKSVEEDDSHYGIFGCHKLKPTITTK